MTLYFHNPHFSNLYGTNVYNLLTRRFNHRKYWYITEHLLREGKNVGIFLDLDQNSFGSLYVDKSRRLNRLVTLLEVFAWLLVNRVNPFKVKITWDPDRLTENDVLFSFSFMNLDRPECRLGSLANRPFLKVFHLTHYMFGTAAIAENSRKLGIDFFVAESNLAKYPYFQKHFSHYRKDVYLLPFVPQRRFTSRTPFEGRRNKCLAMGTYSVVGRSQQTEDYLDFFKVNTIHNMRGAIYEQRDRIGPCIDSSISFYNEEVRFREVKKEHSVFRKLRDSLWNVFGARQSAYFSTPSEQLYNDYRMFVVPEENNNLPGIGFVEGMACGCAYFGIDDPLYTDLGLRPGVHYVAYDNTLDGLLDRIRYYQDHPDELSAIARNGYEFVTGRFNGGHAARRLREDLERLAERYRENNRSREGLSFDCSFIEHP